MGAGERDAIAIIAVVLAVGGPAALISFEWTRSTINEQWEADAVKHGAAIWTVDESGKRVFEWKGETE